MKKKKNAAKGVLLAAAVMILLAAGGAYIWTQSAVIQVHTVPVALGSVRAVIEDTGTVTSEQVSVIAAQSNYGVTSVLCEVGTPVAAGDLLLTTDTKVGNADVMSLRAQAEGLRAQLSQAQNHARTLRELYENGAVSKIESDVADTQEQELSAQLQSLQYTIRSMESNAGTNRVEAPVSGVVTEMFVTTGDTVVMGMPLAEISDLDRLYVRADLLADDAAKVRVGDRVILEASPEEPCAIAWISPKVSEEMSELGILQKRVEIRVSVADRTGLALGGDMDVKIVTDERDGVATIPKKAVFSQNGADYVYVVAEGTAELREISIGLKGEDAYEILSGIEAGERVILSLDGTVADGSRVKE
ncbi:MAG: efflux RND transporter periplasmic adaptor subunit [Clostridiales Family XIII bacterium]|jgi:RND family efflux transporter MFP subunit|nr:efflux RND transporter periplasmic adaptor subunit [Clostridiales Family XIII bacterium]